MTLEQWIPIIISIFAVLLASLPAILDAVGRLRRADSFWEYQDIAIPVAIKIYNDMPDAATDVVEENVRQWLAKIFPKANQDELYAASLAAVQAAMKAAQAAQGQ